MPQWVTRDGLKPCGKTVAYQEIGGMRRVEQDIGVHRHGHAAVDPKLKLQYLVDSAQNRFPSRPDMNRHWEDLANLAILVDQVRGGAVVVGKSFAVDVRCDLELGLGLESFDQLAMRRKISVLLGDGDHHGFTLVELAVRFLQLNQLRRAERSPMGSVRGHDDVLLAKIIRQVDGRTIATAQTERCSRVTELQRGVISPGGSC